MIKAKITVENYLWQGREMNGREEGQAGAFNYMWNVYLLSR